LKRAKTILLLPAILALAAAGAISCAPPQTAAQTLPPTGWQIGNLAPDFSLVNPDSKLVSLSDFRGKPVLVNFWATWCPSCQLEMPFLQQVNDNWSGKGLILLAIDSGESPAKVKEFFASKGLSLPVLFDFTGSTSDRYGVSAIPTTFFIDATGVIKQKMVGAFPSAKGIEMQLRTIMP
jgi:thiol-disulfide isomerase/thioredoxin